MPKKDDSPKGFVPMVVGVNESSLKGFIPMIVGVEEETERILVDTKLLKHPYIALLLEMSAQEFGYQQKGVIKIPCTLDYFRRSVEIVARDNL